MTTTSRTSSALPIPKAGEVLLESGERHLRVDHAIALHELEGPTVRGIPLGDHGFIQVEPNGRVLNAEHLRRRRCVATAATGLS
jgi:hypothetical protein